jgi:hypothetical protein
VHTPCPVHDCAEGETLCPGMDHSKACNNHPPLPAWGGWCASNPDWCSPAMHGCCPDEHWCAGPDPMTTAGATCVPAGEGCPVHPVTCSGGQKKCPGTYDMNDGTQYEETCIPEDAECPLVCNPYVEQYCWTTNSQYCADLHTPCSPGCGTQDWNMDMVACPGSESRDCGPIYPPRPAGMSYCMDSLDNCYPPHPWCCSNERFCPHIGPNGTEDWMQPGFCHPGNYSTDCPVQPTAPPATAPPATAPPATVPPATVPPRTGTVAPPQPTSPPCEKECEGHYDQDGTQMPSTCHAADFHCPVNCNPMTQQYCWDYTNDVMVCGDVNVPCPANCTHEGMSTKCDGGVSRQCTDYPPVPASSEWCQLDGMPCHAVHVHCCPNEVHCPGDYVGAGSCHPIGTDCALLPQPTHPPGTPEGTECPDPCYCLAPEVACDDGNGHHFCHAAPCPQSLQ